ncbi:Ubiquitin carboxyl-terminal hydrolase 12 [Saguinus oedipus]|uniref:ubiquitinyl hydrolase 1 n=1 Tax=Saguinus oedipus TaxID=9490 RepID=A0ABQ9VT77_SAGOE|nr:Ubiquitin carboxyl-terminal hydrolase 12 [Saguinus oedipus]
MKSHGTKKDLVSIFLIIYEGGWGSAPAGFGDSPVGFWRREFLAIWMKVKKLPMILALHLKRFKYMDQLHRYTKLSYRVVFPLELRLFNTSGDATNPDRMYDLVAVVVHCGSGPNRGHYIAIVKSHDFWLLFDDDIVEKIDAQAIEEFYGLTSDISKNSESGYILFYQSRD